MPHRLEEEKIYLNALNLLFRENFLKLPQIIAQYHSFQEAFNDLTRKQDISLDPLQEWGKLEKNKIKFITLSEEDYPPLLKEIPYPPLGIYVKGEIPEYNKYYYLAVVGTRKISSYGKLAIENC